MEQASKQNQNNATNPPKLQPVIPEKKLHNNEIGVKSELKGREIKRLVDRTIDKLIYKKLPTVILKARGKSTSKLISIIDILRSKIVGLYVIQKTYSTKFKSEKEPNKEIKLPCMDATLSLFEPEDKSLGFYPPKPSEEMDKNCIDPKKLPKRGKRENINRFRGSRGFKPGFRGRGRGRGRGVAVRIRGNRNPPRNINPNPHTIQANPNNSHINANNQPHNSNNDNNYHYHNFREKNNNYYKNFRTDNYNNGNYKQWRGYNNQRDNNNFQDNWDNRNNWRDNNYDNNYNNRLNHYSNGNRKSNNGYQYQEKDKDYQRNNGYYHGNVNNRERGRRLVQTKRYVNRGRGQ